MIDDLPPDVRALVSASRTRLGPDAATVARLQANVHAAVAAAAVGAGGAATASTAAASSAAAKLGIVVVSLAVATVAAVGTVAYVRHAPSRPAVAPTIEVASTQTTAAEPDVAPRIVSSEREPAPPAATEPAAPAANAPSEVAPTAATPTPPARPKLAREIALVDQASQALHRGDQAAVAAAISTYNLETAGHGQLAEDAAAIALEAACVSNAPDAATKLAAFNQRWPKSGQHNRLAAVCHKGNPE